MTGSIHAPSRGQNFNFFFLIFRFFENTKQFLDAAFECDKDKGHLVSFEDLEEIKRFKTHFVEEKRRNISFLTSGLFIESTWIWSGASKYTFPLIDRVHCI